MAGKRQAEFVRWMGPVLNALRALGGEARPRDVSDKIAELEGVSETKRLELMASQTERFYNQVQWARQYLVWQKLIDSSKHGWWVLTTKGAQTKLTPEQSRAIFLKWVKIHAERRKTAATKLQLEVPPEDEVPPDEKDDLELLDVIRNLPPKGFERLCQRLLTVLGLKDIVVTGKPGDRGIDGVGLVQINPLVTLKVIFQCKRWTKGSVGRKEIADLRNAVLGRAEKGIIFATATFTPEARREANRDGVIPIELVDCDRLVELMQANNLGVTPRTVYEVDHEFFEQYHRA